MMELRRINPVSLGKMLALIFFLFGFISGIAFSVISLSLDAMLGGLTGGMSVTSMLPFLGMGYMSIAVFTVVSAIMGFISGFLSAVFYNLIAGKFGGVMIDLQQAAEKPRPSPQPAQIPARPTQGQPQQPVKQPAQGQPAQQ